MNNIYYRNLENSTVYNALEETVSHGCIFNEGPVKEPFMYL